MGFYIKIEKTNETEQAVQYTFESDRGRCGIIEINKKSGESTLIKPMPEDERLHCFNRALVKITREWREGRLPQSLEWAS
jgi:hypothetical protein